MTPCKCLVNGVLPGRQQDSGRGGGQDALDDLRVSASIGNKIVNVKHAGLFFQARLRGLLCLVEVLSCSGILSAHSRRVYQGTRGGGVSGNWLGKAIADLC